MNTGGPLANVPVWGGGMIVYWFWAINWQGVALYR